MEIGLEAINPWRRAALGSGMSCRSNGAQVYGPRGGRPSAQETVEKDGIRVGSAAFIGHVRDGPRKPECLRKLRGVGMCDLAVDSGAENSAWPVGLFDHDHAIMRGEGATGFVAANSHEMAHCAEAGDAHEEQGGRPHHELGL